MGLAGGHIWSYLRREHVRSRKETGVLATCSSSRHQMFRACGHSHAGSEGGEEPSSLTGTLHSLMLRLEDPKSAAGTVLARKTFCSSKFCPICGLCPTAETLS